MVKNTTSNKILSGIGILLSFIVIIPLYYVVINSFKSEAAASEANLLLPDKWYIIENYSKVFNESRLLSAFINSTIVTVSAIIIVILLCSISAFVIQRRADKLSRILQNVMLGGIIIPMSIITTYIIMYKLKMTGTYWGVILLYVAMAYPFSTYIMTGFFNTIPRTIDESAIIDGCGGLKMFYLIIFPLMKPVVATVVILNFIGIWGDFNTAIYFFNNSKRYTLALTVYFFKGMYSSQWNYVFANLVMISLPVVILYFFLQKYIISGLTSGAVKG